MHLLSLELSMRIIAIAWEKEHYPTIATLAGDHCGDVVKYEHDHEYWQNIIKKINFLKFLY